MTLELVVIGLNHTTAPVAVREQAMAVCTRDELHEDIRRRLNPALFPEHVLLSTCNRTEMYVATTDLRCGITALREAFHWNKADLGLAHDPLYMHAGRAAAEHLPAVAAGLDSLVLGEFEILGQVRRAYENALATNTVGPTLHQVFQSALRVGKRARAETEIGSGALSVASAALGLARQQLKTLHGRTVLILGSGEMGRRTAENLRQEIDCSILIANRTREHAEELAQAVNGRAITFEEMPAALERADLVVVATQAPHYILDGTAFPTSAPRPLCIVDLSMPRNVDPAVGQMTNVHLFNLDDLQAVVANTRTQRAGAIAQVQGMIAQETDAFETWQQARDAAPLLAELYARAEAIRHAEVEKTLRRLQHLPLSDRDRNVIAALANGVANKILAAPTIQLKALAQQENADQYLRTARELFELSETRNHADETPDA